MTHHPRRTRVLPVLSPVAAAVSTLLIGALPAHAQEQITVTGVRHAIETSLTTKRDSDSIVEAVTAEDIGKLPDVSIAESLARLPGLAAQRVDGRAQIISIRGMGGKYSGTLLNGREMVSTSDNRDAEYDQFPSELLGSALVYKTTDAALIGQGISGTVDMRTVRPLDFRGRQLAFNLRGEVNSNGQLAQGGASDKGGRFSVAYIDQFANNTVGVALGYAHLDTPGQEKHYKSWWWANTADWGRPVQGAPAGAITLNGFEATVTSSKQTRDGALAVIEFKPNQDFHSTVDLFYSKFDQKKTYRGLMTNTGPTWNDATEPVWTNPTTSNVNGDTILTGGTIGNLKPVIRSDYNTREDKITAIGWNNELKLAGWKAVADLSWSKSKRDEQLLETYAGTLNPGSFAASIATGAGVSQFTPLTYNYADPNVVVLSDPAGWGHDGLVKYPKVEDEVKSLRLSGRRDLETFISAVEFGGNYTQRTKEVDKEEFNVNLKNGRAPVAVPGSLQQGSTSLSFAGIPGVLSWDTMGAFNTLYDISPTGQNQAFGRKYDVEEKIATAFVRGDIDSSFEGMPLHGNVGLQVVRAKQHSNGVAWTGSAAVPIDGGATYTDVLPSVNLVLDIQKNLLLRFGAARQMARPSMEDMRAGFTDIGIDNITGRWSANGGNPGLKPWRANAFDLTLEKYLSKASYVSAGAFYKKLKNFIYKRSIDYDFSGFPIPDGVTPPPNLGTTGTLNAPANGDAGVVAGVELAAALEGGLVASWLEGFGVQASHARSHSSLHEDNDVNKPLDGLSPRVNSLTVYYERFGFSARASQRYRSAFVTTTRGVFLDGVTSRIESEKQVDLQLGYNFDSGALKGLGLLLQVNNATDEPYRTRKGIDTGSVTPGATLPEKYTTYGRSVLFGLNYKM